jgi:hypothetical protein
MSCGYAYDPDGNSGLTTEHDWSSARWHRREEADIKFLDGLPEQFGDETILSLRARAILKPRYFLLEVELDPSVRESQVGASPSDHALHQ